MPSRRTPWLAVVTSMLATLLVVGPTYAGPLLVFRDRVSFHQALDADPGLAKTVEGWDTFAAPLLIPNGSTLNGITYHVSTGEAVIVNTGISFSGPNNLFHNAAYRGFDPLVDTFTFVFSQDVTAFGITVSSSFAVEDGDYWLRTDRGEIVSSFFDPLWPGFPLGQFAGFIADKPVKSVTMGSNANAYYGLDDLIYARAVSEPSALLLLGTGLVGLVSYGWQKRRAA